MARINLDQANRIIAGAYAKAAEMTFKPLAVIVLDGGGIPIAYARQDGSSNLRFEIARGKAWGALGMGVSSRALTQMAEARPVFVAGAIAASEGRLITSPGGVLVVDESGYAIGAVGISGDTGDNDEICALAGIAAAGLTAGPT